MPSRSSVVNLRECYWTRGTNAREASVIKGSSLGNHDIPCKDPEVSSIPIIEGRPKGFEMQSASKRSS